MHNIPFFILLVLLFAFTLGAGMSRSLNPTKWDLDTCMVTLMCTVGVSLIGGLIFAIATGAVR